MTKAVLKNGWDSLVKMFTSKSGQGHFVVVGCGRLGANIANTLYSEKMSVAVIDKDRSAFRRLSPEFGGKILLGEGIELPLLYEADVRGAAMMIAVTNDDNTNILISQMAREMFHINRVIARISDPEKAGLCEAFDISVISPIVLAKKEIDSILGIVSETDGGR